MWISSMIYLILVSLIMNSLVIGIQMSRPIDPLISTVIIGIIMIILLFSLFFSVTSISQIESPLYR